MMFKLRSIIIFFTLLFILISCKNKEIAESKKAVFFKGHIENEISNFTFSKIDILSDESEVHLVEVDSVGNFAYTLAIDFPQSINLGITTRNNRAIFVFPNDTVTINFNGQVVVRYADIEHQSFFDNLRFIQNEIQESINKNFEGNIFKELPEKDFKLLLDSIRSTLVDKVELFTIENNVNDLVKQDLIREVDFFIVSSMSDYEFLNKNIFKQERNIPQEFYCLRDTLLRNTDNFKLTNNAFTFLNRLQCEYPNPITEISINKILALEPSVLRDIILCRAIYSSISNKEFSQAKIGMENYFSSIENKTLKRLLVVKYEKALAIFNNPNLNTAKLKYLTQNDKTGILKELKEKYKNKVLYLKFWAPYCGPCMQQLPYVKKMEEKINPEKFLVINLCAPYPKDKWKATIKRKNIGGVHYLLNENQYAELKALFNIHGIPRYVLINRNGEIDDDDAPFPGDVLSKATNFELIELINEMIGKE